MVIEHPSRAHIPALRRLWQQAFGDTEAFLDSFFSLGFSPDRCLCVLEENAPAAALYWLDCSLDDLPCAYVYAVATRSDCRGRGLCRSLMGRTRDLLCRQGYAHILLVPQGERLQTMYAAMGYRNFGGLTVTEAEAAGPALPLRAVGPEEFARLRRSLLPPGGVIQEGPSLAFLADQLRFFAGDGFTLAAWQEDGMLHGTELLGTGDPGRILTALGFPRGEFRGPGADPFAMYLPLTEAAPAPGYLGFAFD